MLNSKQFIRSSFNIRKGGRQLLADCTECKKEKKLYIKNEYPYPFDCKSCGFSGNVFTLGFNSDKNKTNFTDLDKKIWAYRKNTGKQHRLSDGTIKEFNISLQEFENLREKGKFYKALSIFNSEGDIIKKLVDKRWISPRGKSTKWYNVHRVNQALQVVYIVAGEWDGFSFWEHSGIHPIIAVQGETKRKNWQVEKIIPILNNKNIVIIFDSDNAGFLGASSLARDIKKSIPVKSIKTVDMGALGYNDVDDFFAANGNFDKLENLIENTGMYVEQVEVSSALDYFKDFLHLKITDKGFEASFIDFKALPHSIFSENEQVGVWFAGQQNENYKRQILERMASFHSDSEKQAEINKRIKSYELEYDDMASQFLNFRIEAFIKDNFVVKSKVSNETYYRYENGCYKRILQRDIDLFSERIVSKVISDSKPRRQLDFIKLTKRKFEASASLTKEVEFDNHEWIANFQNCFFDIRNQRVIDHSPDYYFTNQLPVNYNEMAECPNFLGALETWFSHSDHTRDEFIKIMLYLISGYRGETKFVFFYGEKMGEQGANAKSEIASLFTKIVGEDFTSNLGIEEMEKDYYLPRLENKILNVTDEVGKSKSMNNIESKFKRITSGSPIDINPKYERPYAIKPKALCIILSNHPYKNSDSTYGGQRRFKLLTLKKIEPKKQVKNFVKTKLIPELEGILYHIVTVGWILWKVGNGFKDSLEDLKIKDSFDTLNPVFDFWGSEIQTFFDEKPNESLSIFEFLDHYKKTTGRTDESYLNIPIFFDKFKKQSLEAGYKAMSIGTFTTDTIGFFSKNHPEIEFSKKKVLADVPKGMDDMTFKKQSRQVLVFNSIENQNVFH